MTILVTGGCGFIGTNFIHRYMDLFPDERVVNVDKLTYAGNPLNHIKLRENPNYSLYAADLLLVRELTRVLHGSRKF